MNVDGIPVHVVEAGAHLEPVVVFLHGWPENWRAFERVMLQLALDTRVVAIDLPGIGESEIPTPSFDKQTIARYVRGVIQSLKLDAVTLVGHDVGGQIVYAYLHAYPGELQKAAIMNVAIPGVDPWSDLQRNATIWHFAFHKIPNLPERLVAGRQAVYFGHFYDLLSARPDGVGEQARLFYVQAYTRPSALRTGFEWYRAFAQDERDNLEVMGESVETPVLYLRGDADKGLDLEGYLNGLRKAGLRDVTGWVIPRSGHFSMDESPDEVAGALRRFIRLPDRSISSG